MQFESIKFKMILLPQLRPSLEMFCLIKKQGSVAGKNTYFLLPPAKHHKNLIRRWSEKNPPTCNLRQAESKLYQVGVQEQAS